MYSSHQWSYWMALRKKKKVYLVSCFYLTSSWLQHLHSAVWELRLFSVASVFYCAGASNTTHDHHHDVHTAQRPLHVTSSSGAVCTSIASIVQSHWEPLNVCPVVSVLLYDYEPTTALFLHMKKPQTVSTLILSSFNNSTPNNTILRKNKMKFNKNLN